MLESWYKNHMKVNKTLGKKTLEKNLLVVFCDLGEKNQLLVKILCF